MARTAGSAMSWDNADLVSSQAELPCGGAEVSLVPLAPLVRGCGAE
jgi:hypothetical protein